MQLKNYRKGPVGVLADLYLMEIEKIKFLMDRLHDEYFLLEINPNSESDFQSVRNIMTHVIRSGYSYANQIRKRFGKTILFRPFRLIMLEKSTSCWIRCIDTLWKHWKTNGT